MAIESVPCLKTTTGVLGLIWRFGVRIKDVITPPSPTVTSTEVVPSAFT